MQKAVGWEKGKANLLFKAMFKQGAKKPKT
jgi:hypothetical protein